MFTFRRIEEEEQDREEKKREKSTTPTPNSFCSSRLILIVFLTCTINPWYSSQKQDRLEDEGEKNEEVLVPCGLFQNFFHCALEVLHSVLLYHVHIVKV